MTKISLIAVFSVWLFAVYGQIPFNNFDPYHAYYNPYTSTFTNQPIRHVNDGTAAQSGGTTEFKNNPSIRDLYYRGAIFLRIKQLEETTASLARQLKAMQTALDLKADKTALDKTNADLKEITTPSSIGKIPTSCGDLKNIGFVKSGIFSIMDGKQVKNVYCDFTKTTEAELQKMIGTVDVKSTPIYFHAQMSKTYSAALTTIPFDSIKLNVGTALNRNTGIFLAPTPGKYYFTYSGISDSGVRVRVLLQMKTGTTDWILVGEGFGDNTYKTFSMHATLELVKGDQVRLYLSEGRIHEAVSTYYFNYVGWLVEENELTV